MENEYQQPAQGNPTPESGSLTKKERKALKREEKQQTRKRNQRKRFLKRIVFFGGAVAVVGALVVGIIQLSKTSSVEDAGLLVDAVSASDWVKGGDNASVLIVEYADFQCPACGSFYPLLKKLGEDFPDDVQIVFRHFPLQQIHQNAGLAAQAAEAAGRQGKFWEMHDMIFERQSSWSNKRNAEELFREYAQALKLNIEQFDSDINDTEIKNKIENQYSGGARSGVRGTPTLFVNGEKIKNPRSYEELRVFIASLIAKTAL